MRRTGRASGSTCQADPVAEGTRLVVVGGGIAGLAAAHRLAASGRDVDVVVLEGSPSLGGKLRLGEVAGIAVDLGAEALLNRRPEAVSLARAVGLGHDVCYPATARATIWTRAALRPMPPNILGVPTDLRVLHKSRIVTPSGLVRAALEPLLPRPRLEADTSVAAFVTARLGSDITDRLVEPLLGGVYAGHASRLSLQAAAPQLASLAAAGGSLLTAARSVAAQSAGTPVFAGIRGGVGRLPAAVAALSDVRVRTNALVRELSRRDAWQLVVGSTREPELLSADGVVLATPATPTARLLRGVCPEAARELAGIPYASTAIVTLAVPRSAMPPVTGSGFLVPPVEGRSIKGATYSWRKWAWLTGGRRDGVAVLRASIGRHGGEHLLQRDDAELLGLVRADLEQATGLRAPPLDSSVTRWGGALPQYEVGHRDRVARIRSAVARLPGLEVCGAAYDGIGVAACVADGQRAADRLLAALRARGTMTP